MANGTCSIEGCERKSFCKSWCHAHYNRWRRNGDVGSAHVQSRRTGCSVDGCEQVHSAKGYCQKHAYRARKNGDPLVTRSTGSPAGETNPAWLGDDVSYAAVHRRLRVFRGKAATFACIRCGSPARDWAYQHAADDERICTKAGLPYSTDLTNYEPMCSPCHGQLDALHGWSRPARRGGVSQVAQTGRWRAYATIDGRQHWGGMHDTREEAEAARDALRARLLTDWQAAST